MQINTYALQMRLFFIIIKLHQNDTVAFILFVYTSMKVRTRTRCVWQLQCGKRNITNREKADHLQHNIHLLFELIDLTYFILKSIPREFLISWIQH